MIYISILLLLLLSTFCQTIYSSEISVQNSKIQKRAAENVISRILGTKKAEKFNLHIRKMEQNDGFNIFKSAADDKVDITGSNGVSLVWGVNYYLKNYCNCHFSWDGDQFNIPDELPNVNITVVSHDKVRYYQNACTSSYSFVWWDWKRWEREIDWMAFNGINLVLAFTAQEAIWQRVYDGLGLTYNDFTGPAFLSWNRMGNLRNYSYGLPNSWHINQISLQHKILKRLRDLGIMPILPAFCGVVPRSFEKAFPLAKLSKMSKWSKFSNDYCCPYLLDPKDALFQVVSHIFLREYRQEFGTNHLYNCDVFNENIPKSGNPFYLRSVSKSIYNAISQIDYNAIWVVQGWMFIDPFWSLPSRAKAFISGVPIGKMLILDLQSDLTPQYKRLNSYFGQPFIWCTLHNFGGQLGMYGHLSRLNVEIPKGRQFQNSTMIGIGIAPEGIDQNYIMYDFTLDSAFRSEPINLSDWVSRYALRRYGTITRGLNQAWMLLKDTVYNYLPELALRVTSKGVKSAKLLAGEHISKNILTKLPSLHLSEVSWYNQSKIYDVYLKFLEASNDPQICSSLLFQHDFIDVTRQTIQTAVSGLYFNIIKEYAQLHIQNFLKSSEMLLEILNELDLILSSGRKFLLGTWLEDAKKLGTNENDTFYYEYNARNQITLWGPNGEIRDYAAKQWSGLINDYYKPRWLVFIEALNKSLTDHKPCNYSETKRTIFLKVEKPFSYDRKLYPTLPRSNTIEIIKNFNSKWENRLYEIFKSYPYQNERARYTP